MAAANPAFTLSMSRLLTLGRLSLALMIGSLVRRKPAAGYEDFARRLSAIEAQAEALVRRNAALTPENARLRHEGGLPK